jgi:hypothetical protein
VDCGDERVDPHAAVAAPPRTCDFLAKPSLLEREVLEAGWAAHLRPPTKVGRRHDDGAVVDAHQFGCVDAVTSARCDKGPASIEGHAGDSLGERKRGPLLPRPGVSDTQNLVPARRHYEGAVGPDGAG